MTTIKQGLIKKRAELLGAQDPDTIINNPSPGDAYRLVEGYKLNIARVYPDPDQGIEDGATASNGQVQYNDGSLYFTSLNDATKAARKMNDEVPIRHEMIPNTSKALYKNFVDWPAACRIAKRQKLSLFPATSISRATWWTPITNNTKQ